MTNLNTKIIILTTPTLNLNYTKIITSKTISAKIWILNLNRSGKILKKWMKIKKTTLAV